MERADSWRYGWGVGWVTDQRGVDRLRPRQQGRRPYFIDYRTVPTVVDAGTELGHVTVEADDGVVDGDHSLRSER